MANPSQYSVNECVFLSLVRVLCSYVLKAADRRDRLIYVLSQINAARGEGTAEAEESSSEEEEAEAEVRPNSSRAQKTRRTHVYTPGILHRRDRGSTRSQEVNGRVFPTQVGFPLYRPVGVIRNQVLTIFPAVLFDSRAQKRIAQQRIDSRIPLGKLIDLRKKIYANVKVRVPTLSCTAVLTDGL